MHDLPIELWMKTFENLGKVEWLVLCMVCHNFRRLTQAYLFKTIAFNDDESLMSFLHERQGLVQLVHNLTINFMGAARSLNKKLDFSPLSNLSSKFLWNFKALRTLVIQCVYIDANSFTALQSLPLLQEVRYVCCSIAEDHITTDPTKWSTELSKVSINYPFTRTGWTGLLPTTVSSLSLGIHAVPTGEDCPGVEILAEILRSRRDYAFTDLSFEMTMPQNIVEFLILFPHVRRLSLGFLAYSGVPPLKDLPSTALPLLEYVSGRSKYSKLVIPGRPVHTAVISVPSQASSHAPSFLQLSGAPIITLTLCYDVIPFVPPWDETETDVARGFFQHIPPTVRRLRLVEERKCIAPEAWMSALSELRIPRLYTMELAGVGVPHKSQQEFMGQKASTICQLLSEVIFSPGLDESKGFTRWRRRNGGDWVSYPVDFEIQLRSIAAAECDSNQVASEV